jgi:hypothetical protein
MGFKGLLFAQPSFNWSASDRPPSVYEEIVSSGVCSDFKMTLVNIDAKEPTVGSSNKVLCDPGKLIISTSCELNTGHPIEGFGSSGVLNRVIFPL